MLGRFDFGRSRSSLICGALLILHVVLVLHAAGRHSATFDEVTFPSVGYAHLTTGDYRLGLEHPPLLKLLTGATWLGNDLRPDQAPGWEDADQWAVGMHLLYDQAGSSGSLLFRARSVIAVLSVVLGLAVFVVARQLAGDPAAIAALALYVFDPLVIAHAGVTTTDLGVTCFNFLAAICFAPALLDGGTRRIVFAGGLLGLALASKHSSLPLVGLLVALGGSVAWLAARGADRLGGASPRTVVMRAATTLALAAGVLVVTYGPAGPGPYFEGLRLQFPLISGDVGHPTYAFGHYGTTGSWWYFPAAWMVKTPLPILIASVVGAVLLARRLPDDPWRTAVLLAAPALVAAPALASSLNLGVRHVLPMTPFLAVAGGVAVAAMFRRGGPSRWIAAGLIVWLAVGTLRVHPHEMAYANEPAGGPSKLWTKLADSNLDWGQDLPALAEEIGKHPLRRLYLGYFGTADPAAHGIEYTWIPSMRMIERRFEDGPDPDGKEWIALSVTNLLAVYDEPKDRYRWLMERPFTAFPGYTIALFDITGDADAHERLGRLAISLGDAVAAEPPIRRAVELRPDKVALRIDLARILGTLRRFPEANVQCDAARRLSSDPELRRLCDAIAAASRSIE